MINRKPTLTHSAKAALAAALTLGSFACNNSGSGNKPAVQTPQKQLSSSSGKPQETSGTSTVTPQQAGMQITQFAVDSRANTAQGDVPNLVAYTVELNGNSVPLSNVLLQPNSTFSNQVGDMTYVGAAKCMTPQCKEIAVFVTATSPKSNEDCQAAAIFSYEEKGGWIAQVTSPSDAQYKSLDDAIQSLTEIRDYRQNQYGDSGAKAPAPAPTPTPSTKAPVQRDPSTQALSGSLGG